MAKSRARINCPECISKKLLVHCGHFTRTLRPLYSHTPGQITTYRSAKPLPVVWDNGRGNAGVCGKKPYIMYHKVTSFFINFACADILHSKIY